MRSAFISHSSVDDRYVAELEQLLRQLDYAEIFNDSHSIAPDEEFLLRIQAAIAACDAFVVVLSHSSVNSYWVDREVQFARQEKRKVIPVRIDDCRLPAAFEGRDVIDLRQGRGDKVRIASSRIMRHAPQHLFGRDEWLDALDHAWTSGKTRIYSLVAWGGAGKTSVIGHWIARRMSVRRWPGVERYFDWTFYAQGVQEQAQVNADLFMAEALTFFDDPQPQAGSPWERGQRLAKRVRQHRALLVLDGVEPLQYPPNSPQAGEFKDESLAALLHGLAMDQPGMCVVTSRYALQLLQAYQTGDGTVCETALERLPRDAGRALLRHLDITGHDDELDQAWREVNGHALTLQLLARFLADAHGCDILQRNRVNLVEADRETPGRSAGKILRAYEEWLASAGVERQRDLAVLRLSGLFDRPAQPDCLAALRAPPVIPGLTDEIVGLQDWQWEKAIKDLARLDLVTLSRDGAGGPLGGWAVEPHPLVREHFAHQLRTQHTTAYRMAHSRLFDHLCGSTEYRPLTQAGLEPLLQAVAHGCKAGRQREAFDNVYIDRILHGTHLRGDFITRKLGAVGAKLQACAAFFDAPWHTVTQNLDVDSQAKIFGSAAFTLRSLGRFTEALHPMQRALELSRTNRDWPNAAIGADNLSKLYRTLGSLDLAITTGREGVALADSGQDLLQKIFRRATLAAALHQAGRDDEARGLFEQACDIHSNSRLQPSSLYGVTGFEYCDYLLEASERATWRHVIRQNLDVAQLDPLLAACIKTQEHSIGNLNFFGVSYSLLSTALDHLTHARAKLYGRLLGEAFGEPAVAARFSTCSASCELALHKMRAANFANYLPLALLTRALDLAVCLDRKEESESLLHEAEFIAKRGPMPLYQADVNLHRARLFGDRQALARARELIHRHGYWRRKDELQATEAALI